MAVAGLAMLLIIASLFFTTRRSVAAKSEAPKAATPPPSTRIGSDGSIIVAADSLLNKRLTIADVRAERVTRPLVTVTGSVVARVRAGEEQNENRWQFSSSDLATAYSSWLLASADLEFSKRQLAKTKELVAAQEKHYQSIVKRLAEVAETGVAIKDVNEAKAKLLEAQLQGEKDIYAEESGVRRAQQQVAANERELAQLGIEPLVLTRWRPGMVLIAANVPEAKVSLVREQQACEARFFAFPQSLYTAHVEHLGTIFNTERRTLRVLFDLTDDQGRLRPGMFAEVFLGTEERQAISVPLTAVIHVAHSDYAFRQRGDGSFELVKVVISEPFGDQAEVLEGLAEGDRVVTAGAILLKPLALLSLAGPK